MLVPDVLVSDPSPPRPPAPQVPLIVKSEPQEYLMQQPSTTSSSQTESSPNSSKRNRNNNNVIESLDTGKCSVIKISTVWLNRESSIYCENPWLMF